jgi:hypothetical protein
MSFLKQPNVLEFGKLRIREGECHIVPHILSLSAQLHWQEKLKRLCSFENYATRSGMAFLISFAIVIIGC